jgi:hypothetical protein
MIANPSGHRRANAFAKALEDGGPQAAGGEHGAHAADRKADPNQGWLLTLADALEDVPRPKLDEQKKIEQRAQLIAAMEASLADGTLKVPERRGGQGAHRAPAGVHRLRPRSRWSRRLAAGGLSMGVAAGTLGGVAAASTNALPGDTLYGLKRGMEDMRLDLTNGNAARGEVYLDLASTRLQEARRLMERDRSGALDQGSVSDMRKALSSMQQEASEGHRLLSAAYKRDGSLQSIQALNAFSSSHRKGWSELRERLPSQLTDMGNKVNSVFDAMEHEVAPLKSLLPAVTQPSGSTGHPDGTGGARSGGSGRPAPSSTQPASGSSNGGKNGSAPAASASSGTGLVGGTGDLLGTGSSPSAGASTSQTSPPSITLPPLLPGILPRLGLGTENDGS